jgi:hypothetical protein
MSFNKPFIRIIARVAVFSAITLICLADANAQSTKRDATAIRYGKATLVSRIEKGLPNQRFDAWLRKLAGKNARLTWEVNDCGEQTGTPADRGRDFPMCVEANAQSGDMAIVISIMVGTFKRGIAGRPRVRYAQLHFEGEEHETINKLTDFAPAIKKATGS